MREQVQQVCVVADGAVVQVAGASGQIASLGPPGHALDDAIRLVVPLHEPVG